tara:strand:- start:14859 stop:15506 length:648 start_codon:yes stop_codon:yes gene_type:complete
MIKDIFFDFDGVLVESVNVKTEAFRNLYLPYGNEIADKVVEHHQNNGGVSRFEKFKIYHKSFLNEEIDELKVQELANQFSNLALDGVLEAPNVKGAKDFLENYKDEFNYWIITGTPTTEIKIILDRKGWTPYFKGVYGSPTKKYEWTESIIEKENLRREEIVFIGDATADYDAANKSGLSFVLRETKEGENLFKEYNGPRIKDISELYNRIKELN